MNWKVVLCCVWMLYSMKTFHVCGEGNTKTHTDIILIGATGDLAKKYLWQSIFQLYVTHENDNTTFSFYGCGRSKVEEGRALLQNIVQKHVTCEFAVDLESCEKKKINFSKIVVYFPLITDIDFQNFGLHLDVSVDTKVSHSGRVVYMSIPPSAYAAMSAKMWNCCYSKAENSWNRLVLEKPFGSDYKSAVRMADEVAKYYTEEEIYRVDHYLGKSIVKQILSFRLANKDLLEPLLTRQHVARVEVVMKETIGVQGRIDFYDQYGVIRDVMQNHLTELLALVAMELPDDIKNTKKVDSQRLKLLSQVKPVRQKSVLIGQYADYVMQAQMEKDNVTMSKFTPTFAAALLGVENYNWHSVPFLLVSGKHLDERSSFIRIKFKDNDFCIAGCRHYNGSHWRGQKQIIFQIGHGNLPSAGVLVSRDLFKPVIPSGLKDLPITADDIAMYGQNLNDFYFLVPTKNKPAYVTVIEDMYMGRKESFVVTERLLSLWQLWSPVLNDLQSVPPRIYQHNEDRSLNFKLDGNGLRYVFDDTVEVILESSFGNQFGSLPVSFLGNPLIVKSSEELVILAAAERIEIAIKEVLKQQTYFNIAFSGGKTPVRLFEILAEKYSHLPWEFIHIWQVDERCVSNVDDKSNFKKLHNSLIQNIRIPYFNIHPMPVNVNGRSCDINDEGHTKYAAEIQYHIPNLQIDLILLGLGADGHTASLFPNKFYDLSLIVAMDTENLRMTLTFPVLNKGRQIMVLVTGNQKHAILSDLLEDTNTVSEYPVLGVKPVFGNLTWFIDTDAWYGT